MRRIVVAVTLVGALVWGLALPAIAQEIDEDGDRDDVVVLTGRVVVAPNETVGSAVIFDGPAAVAGTVRESLIVFNGRTRVSGRVGGDVVSFNGPVTIASGARVEGDVVSRRSPTIEPGAVVDGDISRLDPDAFDWPARFATRLAFWLAVSISLLLLGLALILLAPRAADALAAAGRRAWGPAIGWGLLLVIGLPILGVVLCVTLLGLPLGLVLLFALGLIYAAGYAAAAWVLGRTFLPAVAPLLAFLAGWAALRVVALVPVLGGLVAFAATVFGLGALAVALWRARRGAPFRGEPAYRGGPEGTPVPGASTPAQP